MFAYHLLYCSAATFATTSWRMVLPYVQDLGTPALQRRIVELLPVKSIQHLITLTDQLTENAKEVFYLKKRALEEGDEGVVKQVGEGKDIISRLCKHDLGYIELLLPDEFHRSASQYYHR